MPADRRRRLAAVALATVADALLAVTMARAASVLGAGVLVAVACGVAVVLVGLLPLRVARRRLGRGGRRGPPPHQLR